MIWNVDYISKKNSIVICLYLLDPKRGLEVL